MSDRDTVNGLIARDFAVRLITASDEAVPQDLALALVEILWAARRPDRKTEKYWMRRLADERRKQHAP